MKNGICTASEYVLKLPLSATPIRIIPVIKRLRNLGRIQFVAKSSSIYTKSSLCHKHKTFWRSWRKFRILYNFHRKHILLKLKIKKLLRKIRSKNLSAEFNVRDELLRKISANFSKRSEVCGGNRSLCT